METAISQSIRQLLVKARQISGNKRDGGKVVDNDWQEYQVQSEIYRIFGMMDWMLESISTEEVIKTVREEILITKRELKSEAKDLKLLPIRRRGRVPSSSVGNENLEQLACFPYSDLIPEMREKILGNLTAPQDKLNILKVFPNAGPLMYWDPTNFYFELVYPLLMNRGYLNEMDVYNLARVSPYFRDVTLNHFEGTMLTSSATYKASNHNHHEDVNYFGLRRTNPYIMTSERKDIIDSGPDWCRENPILLRDLSKFKIDIAEPAQYQESMRTILKQAGNRIFDVDFTSLRLCVYHRVQEFSDGLLRFTPNCRRLKISLEPARECIPNGDCGTAEDLEKLLRDLELPDLQHLKSLQVKGTFLNFTIEKLLKSYEKTLEVLHVENYTIIRDVAMIQAPRLSTLKIRFGWAGFHRKTSNLKKSLTRFHMSPLKVIHIDGKRLQIISHFSEMWSALNEFGGTLEEVVFDVGFGEIKRTEDPTWITHLNFPKMRRFAQKNFGGSWAFLLQFPKLEQLRLVLSSRLGRIMFQHERFLELSWNQDEMRASNIWKLFPELERVSLKKTGPVSHFGISKAIEFEVRRSDAIGFHSVPQQSQRKRKHV